MRVYKILPDRVTIPRGYSPFYFMFPAIYLFALGNLIKSLGMKNLATKNVLAAGISMVCILYFGRPLISSRLCLKVGRKENFGLFPSEYRKTQSPGIHIPMNSFEDDLTSDYK